MTDHDDAGDSLEIVDRYEALGFRPDPATMCRGQCEGIGVYPHPASEPMTDPERAANPAPVADERGWYWLTCPDCRGAGRAGGPPPAVPPSGADLIAAERARQIREEGWTPAHDDGHAGDELALAASAYALPERLRAYARQWASPEGGGREVALVAPQHWPGGAWPRWWKPTPHDRVRELVKAGALIAAEIDRLQRAAPGAGAGG